MKRKFILLSVCLSSVLFFQTGFIGLNNKSTYSFPSLQKSTSVVIADSLNQLSETETEAVSSPETETEKVFYVPSPEIDKQYLTKNEWSRPGKKIKKVKQIVIHYLGNPKTSAQANRDYFESLKDSKDISISSHFIVGLDGEIIQCIPEKEAACAMEKGNKTSLAIETCHMDSTGKYLADTYISMVKLTAYLSEKYDISRKNIVRHYDVNGRKCPRYFYNNPDAWETFLDDVMLYRSLCETKPKKAKKIQKYLEGLDDTYADKKAAKPKKEKETETETEPVTEAVTEASLDTNSDQIDYYEDDTYSYDYYDGSYDGSYDNYYYDDTYYDNSYYDNTYYDYSGYTYYDDSYNNSNYGTVDFGSDTDWSSYEDDGLLYSDYSTDTW